MTRRRFLRNAGTFRAAMVVAVALVAATLPCAIPVAAQAGGPGTDAAAASPGAAGSDSADPRQTRQIPADQVSRLPPGILRRAFLPTVFYVGDTVELYLRVIRPGGGSLPAPIMLTEPQKLPSNPSVRIVSLTVSPREDYDEVHIRFVPFEAGPIMLPEIEAGSFTLPAEPVTVASILAGRPAELAPIRDQAELPGTKIFLYGTVGLIALACLAAFLILKYGLAFLRALVESYRENQPYKIMQRTLRHLADEVDVLDSAAFYDILLAELRGYLSFRLKMNCRSRTTSELRTFFTTLELNANDAARLSSVFASGDLVKFAGSPVSRAAKLEGLADVETVMVNLELPEDDRARI